jgi:hypothetical protein
MTSSFTFQALASMKWSNSYISPKYHSKFLECLANIQYLSIYSLASYYTIADYPVVANTRQGELPTRHEIHLRCIGGRLLQCYVSLQIISNTNIPTPLCLIGRLLVLWRFIFWLSLIHAMWNFGRSNIGNRLLQVVNTTSNATTMDYSIEYLQVINNNGLFLQVIFENS